MSVTRVKNYFSYLAPLCLALALAPLPASAGSVGVYVTNSAGDNIHVIDPTTNKVVQVIEGIEVPHGVNFSPDGKIVYVSNEAMSTLDIVDQKTGKVTKQIPLSGHPNNIAVAKDGRVVVAIAAAPGAVDVYDPAKGAIIKTIPVHGALHNIYVTPDNKYAVAGSVRNKMLTVVDLQTLEPAWELKFEGGVRPMTIEAAPDGSTSRIFVQLSDFHGFVIVDFKSHQEVARVKLPDQPSGFGAQEDRLAVPSHGIMIAPDGKTLWVNSTYANAVFAYSMPDLKLLGHVDFPSFKVEGRPDPIGALSDWIAMTPDSKFVYCSNSGTKSVTVIDAVAMKQVGVVQVGEVPKRMNTLAIN